MPDGRGSGTALEAMYREHHAALISRLRKVFGQGPPHPDDLAQSAFARLASMNDLSAIREPKAFLFRVALNLGFDQLDKQAATRRLHGSYKIHAEQMQNPAPETVYDSDERLERIARLIDTLPDFDRELLRRSRLKGETLSAIAVEQNMSISTLSRRIARIMAELKLRLEREELSGRD